MSFSFEKIISELPDDIKEKTNIDENLEKLEKAKTLAEKEKLLNEVKKEFNNLIEKISNNSKKEKLLKIKEEIEKFSKSLNNLKASVKGGKIIDITGKNLEKELFCDQNDNNNWLSSIKNFFKNILIGISNFFEKMAGGVGSSNANIVRTFERLGYGDKENIKEVLKVISKVKLSKIGEFIKNFYDEGRKQKNFIEKIWDKIENFFGINNKFTKKQKIIAQRILETIIINFDFIKRKINKKGKISIKGIFENAVKETQFKLRNKIGLSKIQSNFDKMTVSTALEYIFPYGLSDYIRGYALPAKGVKLFKFGNKENLEKENNIQTIKIGKYKISKDKNRIYVKINEKNFLLKKICKGGSCLGPKNITSINIDGDNLVVTGKKFIFSSQKLIPISELKKCFENLEKGQMNIKMNNINIIFTQM